MLKNGAPLLLILLLVCCSTDRKVDSKEALIQYAADPENGLLQEKKVDDIEIRVQYRPKDLIVQQNLSGNNSTREVDSLRTYLNPYDYFVLKMGKGDDEIINEYANSDRFEAAVNYVSFNIGKDLQLIHNTDTIPVFDFVLNRSFGMAGPSEWLVIFQSSLPEKNGKCYFQFNDNFFGTGLSQFEFDIENIKSIPSLKQNN